MLGNMDHLKNINVKIWMNISTGNNQRYINVSNIYQKIGPDICKSLPAYHAFTGCDYKKGKINQFKLLMKSKIYQEAFMNLANVTEDIMNTDILATLEKFVCQIYKIKNYDDTNSVRFELFTKNLVNHLKIK